MMVLYGTFLVVYDFVDTDAVQKIKFPCHSLTF